MKKPSQHLIAEGLSVAMTPCSDDCEPTLVFKADR